MKVRALSRRHFLGALGVAGSAAALFPWLAQPARAGGPPKRLVLFFTPHGTVWDRWRPTGGETDFGFSPILAPMERHRDKLVIIDGVRMESGTEYYIPHTYTMPLLWTGSPIDTSAGAFCREDHGGRCFGWNTGISIDQHIANALPLTTPHRTIELGLSCGGAHPASRMIYSGVAAPKTPVDSAARAWSTLFGSAMTDADAIRRRSVLDTVHEDFALRRGRLSSADRARLDAHATSLEELQRTLVPPSALCERPGEPVTDPETAIDRQSDKLAASLACGLTDIASFQLRIADNDNSLYPWTGLSTGGHHTLSHDSGPAAQSTLADLYTWYTARFAYLLDRLAASPDVDGTSLLDNTLVVWGSELGTAWNHDLSNVPFVLAGGAGVGLRGGRYLRVTDTQLNRVLVTACHAMGLTDTATYGSLDTGTGAIPGVLV
jgi:hypothetical protein